MAHVALDIPDEVAAALARQARALLLSRRVYIRAVLAAVASQAGAAPEHQSTEVARAAQ